MKVVGIVAEYNPFHKGHEYHIKEAKHITGADCAVVVMNGNFMQRGEPAFADKYTRTKMALAGGADMVFELPVCFGVSSAEDFAYGSVALLDKLQFVDAICFGSESGNLKSLRTYADFFSNETPRYKERLNQFLREGLGFPAAREKAANEILNEDLTVLSSPNNLLGIEYLKALNALSYHIVPYTISRIGHGYHETTAPKADDFPSATAIRTSYTDTKGVNGIPKASLPFLEEAFSCYRPLSLNDFSEMLYYALMNNRGTFDSFKDISADLAERIENLLPKFESAEQFANLLHTKQNTKGRMNRCLLQVLLGIRKNNPLSPYLRLLGMNREFSYLLKNREDIIVKPAKAMRSNETKEALKQDFFAADLFYYTIYKTSGYVIENEFHQSPIIF